MQTTHTPDYITEVPESDNEKIQVIKTAQAEFAALDPTKVKAFWLITIQDDPDETDPNAHMISRDIAGTGPDKEIMFEYGQEYMKALLEHHFGPFTKREDSPLQ